MEADMFFMTSGSYVFDRDKLFEAHKWCQNTTKDYLKSGSCVVVSNTFTTMKELKPYIKIAEQCKAALKVIRLTKNFGSIHNVPQATMEAMTVRFQDYPGETILSDY
jgi:hypothetical protein